MSSVLRSRRITALLSGVGALCLLAACTTAGSGPGGGKSGSTLVYWSMWKEGEPQQKVLRASLDQFTKETGIKVQVQWAGRQVLQQVVPRLNSGNPPDLTDQDGTSLHAVLGEGALGLQDVYDAQITGETRKVSDIIPASLVASAKKADGQPMLVPYEVVGSTLWYNGKRHPDLVGKDQLDWSAFTGKLDGLRQKGRTPLALDGDISGYDAYWMVWSVVRHGGVGLLNKACQDKTGAAWDDPAFLAAAEDIGGLVSRGYFPKDFNATKFPAQQTAWATGTGKTDLLLMGTWAPSETGAALEKSGKDVGSVIDYRSMPYPTVDGGKGNNATQAGVIAFAVPAKARNTEAAKKFIRFFLAKDRIARISTEADNLTPRSDVPAPSALSDFAKEYAAQGRQFFQPNDDCGSVAAQWVTDVWEPTVVDYFNGRIEGADNFVKTVKDKSVAHHKNKG
ncbi:ABC transporter substrate-binding protein [Streptomyces sp. 35G-GA-8]|uniref:ABC transporter substrate-binding protein n=1 Tax=Streptomyces sp. 35G-GA-8 TaxID=2939434 RepID=UPI00201F3B5E|nr:ABC transporter substrate-binding protein [Streptomyces sp. 35G-GA-8]MCL7380537.1 ABC transporter substrate-binding protein [Streptomyces sp. 35G-GA-8]